MKDLNYIFEKVLALFKRYGTRSVTMDDIAHELGMSKKTLYQEFTDKDDLINRVIDYDMDQSKGFLEEVRQSDSNAVQELFMVNRRMHSVRTLYSPTFYFDLKRYYPEIYNRWIQNKRSNMFTVITENLRKGKQEGIYRPEIDEHIIGRLHIARIEMLEGNNIIEEHERLSNDFIQEVFIYHLHGICNEQGLKIIARERDNFNQQKV
ncbi:MAG: TetR/AcrR family transcriptional regulator [Bacteroides sp.]|nr:TetR/AcrR family transcriptional regulator [Bacteroides sp.]